MVRSTIESLPTHASHHGLSPCAKDETEIQRSDRGMLTNIRLLAEAPNITLLSLKIDLGAPWGPFKGI